jgi:hypothetical protein
MQQNVGHALTMYGLQHMSINLNNGCNQMLIGNNKIWFATYEKKHEQWKQQQIIE